MRGLLSLLETEIPACWTAVESDAFTKQKHGIER
jgi:hypothetical protein